MKAAGGTIQRRHGRAVARHRSGIGIALCAIAIALGLGDAAFTLPWLRNSAIWFQSEPAVAVNWAAAGIAAVGLGVLALDRPTLAWRAIAHPLVVIPGAIALWSLAVLPLARIPGISLFGSPELGEGIWNFIAIAALTAAARALTAGRRGRNALIVAALLAVAATCGLMATGSFDLMPYYFKDFLAFYGIAGAALALALAPTRYRAGIACVVFLVVFLIVRWSDNRAAYGAVLIGLAAYLAMLWFAKRRWVRVAAAAVAGLIPIAATVAIVVVGLAGPPHGLPGSLDREAKSTYDNMLTRFFLMRVIDDAIAREPSRLVTGFGWGHYPELLFEHVPLTNVKLHTLATAGDEKFQLWDVVNRPDFHSHNVYAEGLASGGVVVLLLLCGYLAFLPLCAPRRLLPAATAYAAMVGFLQTFWFTMPILMPVMAVTAAVFTARVHALPVSRGVRRDRRLAASVLGVGCVLFAAAGAVAWMAGAARRAADENMLAQPPVPASACADFYFNFGRGYDHFVWLITQQTGLLEDALGKGEALSPQRVARMERFLCVADRAARSSPSVRVGVADAVVRSDLVFAAAQGESPLRAPAAAGWGDVLDVVLARAPKRTDLAAPYFSWLLKAGREDELLARANRLLQARPSDPVGLWFSGSVLIARTGREPDGLRRMRAAIDGGVERVFPVDETLRAQIRAKTGG